jgi:multisubunit Na+/H+ antiporter MnhG subunit
MGFAALELSQVVQDASAALATHRFQDMMRRVNSSRIAAGLSTFLASLSADLAALLESQQRHMSKNVTSATHSKTVCSPKSEPTFFSSTSAESDLVDFNLVTLPL